MKKSKIIITSISNSAKNQKGFNKTGCYGCSCDDECCKFGADFDKESFDLVFENKQEIQKMIQIPFTEWFFKKSRKDNEYLGRKSIRSKKSKSGFCVFHSPIGKGCALYQLLSKKKISRRIIPSICRLYPLTWNKGLLCLANELPNEEIPSSCNCMDPKNKTIKKILETQKKEIDDIFKRR